MSLSILETYRKDLIRQPGEGYGRRTGGVWAAQRPGPPTSVVIHATHGKPGTRSEAEAEFLRTSYDVSAHYLIARDGRCFRILPDTHVAWHAGAALAAFDNFVSLGIELHAAVTELVTPAQKQTLAALLRVLSEAYGIPATLIDTHRVVALPKGRKSDPAMWDQDHFLGWRDGALTCTEPNP